MPDSLRVIHDTLVIKQFSDLDLLDKVNTFYDSAWNKLLVVATILGVLVPIIIQWYQNRDIRIGRKKLKRDIENAKCTLKKDFEDSISEKFTELDNKFNVHVARIEGKTWHTQGNNSRRASNPEAALMDYCQAARCFAIANSSNINVSINIMEKIITTCKKDNILKTEKYYEVSFNEILSETIDSCDDEKSKQKLSNILDSIQKIIDVPSE